MADRITEVTSQGWFGRIGESIKGILFGIILIPVSFVLLFWNEGRAVKTARSLAEGAAAVVSIAAEPVNPANEGKLVHITGTATTEETLTDPDLHVSAQALKLKRDAQMYQWQEKKESKERKKVGGGTETTTTYTYLKGWDDSVISSSSFKEAAGHENPASMPYSSQTWTASNVRFGAFTLSPSLVGKIGGWQPFRLEKAPEGLDSTLKLADGGLYRGANAGTPQVGDTKITFAKVVPGVVSVVARQAGTTFEPYQTKAGRALEFLTEGTHSAEEMFKSEMSANRMLTWGLRVLGWVLLAMGIGLIFRPFVVFADVLPFLGNILGMGIGCFSFAISGVVSLFIIAIAWVIYRPLVGIALVLVGILGLVGAFLIGKQIRGKRATTQ